MDWPLVVFQTTLLPAALEKAIFQHFHYQKETIKTLNIFSHIDNFNNAAVLAYTAVIWELSAPAIVETLKVSFKDEEGSLT